MRHEENLEKEEEYFLMLVEILRSPELLKSLTGSSIKGETDIEKLMQDLKKTREQ
jgi:hypothetical protein